MELLPITPEIKKDGAVVLTWRKHLTDRFNVATYDANVQWWMISGYIVMYPQPTHYCDLPQEPCA